MSADELRTRGGQFIRQQVDGIRSRLGFQWKVSLKEAGSKPPQFFFNNSDIPALLETLHADLPSAVAEVVARAEDICLHNFDLLGYSGIAYEQRIDWHLDAVNRKRAPRRLWFNIPIFDFEQVGDPKITWELNRHQHLVILAKAALLTGDDRFHRELVDQWYWWQQENPYPIGINWASSLELAFRSLSWLWVLALVGKSPVLPHQFRQDLVRALAVHGMHIENYLSTYSSPNTHLLGEGVGLFFIGMLCPEIGISQRWQEVGWEIVLESARKQVLPDGMHFEQSTYYHVYALDFFLHARILAARNAIEIPAYLDDAIQRMLTLLRTLCDCGDPTRFGDDDGGRVFDPRRNRAEHLADPLATGAVLFQRPDLKRVARTLREETLWLMGVDECRNFDALGREDAIQNGIAAFPDSGIYVLRDGDKQLVVDAGPQGTGNSGHGHADALSVTYASDGQQWLVDPGTYVYPVSARDLLRATQAHNTVVIDGVSQAIGAGPFAWHRIPKTNVESCVQGTSVRLVKAGHNGYSRLSDPATHHRWILQVADNFSMIRDLIDGQGSHRIDSLWHCAPETELRSITPSAFQISRPDRTGPILLAAEDRLPHPAIGWYSQAYGTKILIPVLRFSTETTLPVEVGMLLLHSVQDSNIGTLSTTMANGVKHYRYKTRDREHHMFFSDDRIAWRTAMAESDGEFCYCSFDETGSLLHVFACNVAVLLLNGKHVFSAKKRIEWFEWKTTGGHPQTFHSETPDVMAVPIAKPDHGMLVSLGRERV